MPRNRFVEPEDVRIDISDGDWILIKRQLTNDEVKRAATGALVHEVKRDDRGQIIPGTEEIVIDSRRQAHAKLETWLLDWSFCDASGRPRKLSLDAIKSLDPDTAGEIEAAIDMHQEVLRRERENPPTATTSVVLPPSANGWDGATPTMREHQPT